MRVLSIGTDERVFAAGSAVRLRQEAFAQALGQLDLVVLSKKRHEAEYGQHLSLVAAFAHFSLFRLLHALHIARAALRPDVITVQDPFELGCIGILIARHFGVPLHVQVHTDPFVPGFKKAHWPLNRIRLLIARHVLRHADRIRVVSSHLKQQIEQRYQPRAPITVLPIYIDIARFQTARPSEELIQRFSAFSRKVLVVARLEPEKQVDLAIRAFAEAAPQQACLIIVGEGSIRKQLQVLARATGAAERIFFEGAPMDPAPYYALADLVLVPSRYEGYGMVIVEALAAGKPVLSADVGIAREAGAMVSDETHFADALSEWFAGGPVQGKLKGYPYESFAQYVSVYTADLRACVA